MAENKTNFPWKIAVAAVVVVVGGAAAYFVGPQFFEDKRVVRVVTVPDIPEILHQSGWVLAQQKRKHGAASADGAGLGSEPEAPIAVEGAPPDEAGVGEAPVAVEGAPPGEGEAPEVEAAPAADEPAPRAEAPEPVDEASAGEPEADDAPAEHASSLSGLKDIEPPYELEITATARQVWVWVTADGGSQEAVSLERGESATFEAREGYVLTVDDAGGIEATLNGKALPSFGRKAEARRDVTIPSPEFEPVG